MNEHLEFLQQSTVDAIGWAPTHPKGYFQPGVLALAADGRVPYFRRGKGNSTISAPNVPDDRSMVQFASIDGHRWERNVA